VVGSETFILSFGDVFIACNAYSDLFYFTSFLE